LRPVRVSLHAKAVGIHDPKINKNRRAKPLVGAPEQIGGDMIILFSVFAIKPVNAEEAHGVTVALGGKFFLIFKIRRTVLDAHFSYRMIKGY